MTKALTLTHAVPEGSLHTWIPHIRGHLGKWQLVKQYVCVLEPGNFHDRNVIAVEKVRRIIVHLLQKVLCVCVLFLKRGGTVCCTVTGRQ